MKLEQRLEKVERRCHWLSVALVACISIAAVAAVSGAKTADEVSTLRVSALEVIDGCPTVGYTDF